MNGYLGDLASQSRHAGPTGQQRTQQTEILAVGRPLAVQQIYQARGKRLPRRSGQLVAGLDLGKKAGQGQPQLAGQELIDKRLLDQTSGRRLVGQDKQTLKELPPGIRGQRLADPGQGVAPGQGLQHAVAVAARAFRTGVAAGANGCRSVSPGCCRRPYKPVKNSAGSEASDDDTGTRLTGSRSLSRSKASRAS